MATLLTGTNEVLKRVGLIQGDAGDLTTLTDTPRQHDIDKIGQCWREVTRLLQSKGSLPTEVTQASITLSSSQADPREYAIPADFVQMAGANWFTRVFLNAANKYRMYEYSSPVGVEPDAQMFADQVDPADFTGVPRHWAISRRGAFFRVDRTPTSTEDGLVFNYQYDTALTLAAAGDSFPFVDSVQQELIPVVAHFYNMSSEQRTAEAIMATEGFVTALQFATRNKPRSSYGPYAR